MAVPGAPVPAGAESDPNRVIPATDYAYALMAPGWDPTSDAPPKRLVAVRTKAQVSVARGDTLWSGAARRFLGLDAP